MATIKAPRNMIEPQIPVDAYRNGKLWKSFDSVSECAREFHVAYQTVKYLIASGKELYTMPESVTFDIPSCCPYSYVLIRDDESGVYLPRVKDDRTGKFIGQE